MSGFFATRERSVDLRGHGVADALVVAQEDLGGAEVDRAVQVRVDLDRGGLFRVGDEIDDLLCVHVACNSLFLIKQQFVDAVETFFLRGEDGRELQSAERGEKET